MGFFDTLFAPGETARGQKLDAALLADQQAQLARGRITPADFQTYQADAQNSPASDYNAQIQSEFVAGAQAGLAAEQNAVKKTLAATLTDAIGFVPWWLWLAAGVYLAFELGWINLRKRP